MPDAEDYTEPCPEDLAHIEDCTCEHDDEAHGWGHCNVDGCPCEGGWTE